MRTFMSHSRLIAASTCIVFVIVAVGCHRQQVANDREIVEENMRSFSARSDAHARDIPSEVLAQVPKRLQDLKPGMNPSEVLRVLGMSNFGTFAMSMGPVTNYALTFELRSNCLMTLSFDVSKRPPPFLSAALNGDGWPDSKQ